MTIFKCKMCSAPMEVTDGMTVCECEYCGTKQTLPKLDNDSRLNLYDRANHFRRNNEYDKAMGIYERILNEDKTDAEAYWSLVLCRYGIEYVEDPLTHKRVPTVNRAQFTSVYDDDNYKLALKNADTFQRQVYEDEANAINEIQKGILAISQQEEPFDVFICYKETDNDGRRTRDSVLATDLYHQLTNEGFKVFFSRITLEDKLGTAYEPYIFAALNSAKVMVVLGTKPEFFNAVWVKNEWSRYLSLIKQGQSKMLIPAYRDMDPYDLPEEFSHLQAQDMSKLGFMQDLVRGIKKIIDATSNVTNNTVRSEEDKISGNNGNNIDNLIKRVKIFIEDKQYEEANRYIEKILDLSPEFPDAYYLKLLIGSYKQEDSEKLKIIAERLEGLSDELTITEKTITHKKNINDSLILYMDLKMYERFDKMLHEYIDEIDKNSIVTIAFEKENRAALKLLVKCDIDISKVYRVYENQYGKTNVSPLSYVIWNSNNKEIVELLLKAGADFNEVVKEYNNGNKTEESLLSRAVNRKKIDMVKALLEYGANPNEAYRKVENEYNYSPLSDAIWNVKDEEMVRLLLLHGADPNGIVIDYDNGIKREQYVLSQAVELNNINMVEILLKHGADANKAYRKVENDYNYSALSDAIWNVKNEEIVKLLLLHGADPNGIVIDYDEGGNKTEESLLNQAISINSTNMVEILLEYGADPNKSYRVENDEWKYSPLSDAIWIAENNREIMKLLLAKGENPNEIVKGIYDDGTKMEISLLNHEILASNINAVKLLLKYGADPDFNYRLENDYINDSIKVSPLSDAIFESEDTGIVGVLLENGANPNVKSEGIRRGSKESETLFQKVVRSSNIRMVKTLLKYGADVNGLSTDIIYNKVSKNDVRVTALHMAICEQDTEMIEYLIDNGASMDIEIYWEGIKSNIKKYPYDKLDGMDSTFIHWLKRNTDWDGIKGLKNLFF